jgi:hypothetical protein
MHEYFAAAYGAGEEVAKAVAGGLSICSAAERMH